MSKYTEIFKLKKMLDEADIDYEFHDRTVPTSIEELKWEHYQIIVNKDNERLVSVIQGRGTYGGEENLLEIMGLLTDEELQYDEVVGYLTAEEVFRRIKKAIGD